MGKPKGTLIKWLADCGHWMDAYSLEPTPEECPDCAATPHTGMPEDALPLKAAKR